MGVEYFRSLYGSVVGRIQTYRIDSLAKDEKFYDAVLRDLWRSSRVDVISNGTAKFAVPLPPMANVQEIEKLFPADKHDGPRVVYNDNELLLTNTPRHELYHLLPKIARIVLPAAAQQRIQPGKTLEKLVS